jgi:hypothetical protein
LRARTRWTAQKPEYFLRRSRVHADGSIDITASRLLGKQPLWRLQAAGSGRIAAHVGRQLRSWDATTLADAGHDPLPSEGALVLGQRGDEVLRLEEGVLRWAKRE